jgi:hypothetical protein
MVSKQDSWIEKEAVTSPTHHKGLDTTPSAARGGLIPRHLSWSVPLPELFLVQWASKGWPHLPPAQTIAMIPWESAFRDGEPELLVLC